MAAGGARRRYLVSVRRADELGLRGLQIPHGRPGRRLRAGKADCRGQRPRGRHRRHHRQDRGQRTSQRLFPALGSPLLPRADRPPHGQVRRGSRGARCFRDVGRMRGDSLSARYGVHSPQGRRSPAGGREALLRGDGRHARAPARGARHGGTSSPSGRGGPAGAGGCRNRVDRRRALRPGQVPPAHNRAHQCRQGARQARGHRGHHPLARLLERRLGVRHCRWPWRGGPGLRPEGDLHRRRHLHHARGFVLGNRADELPDLAHGKFRGFGESVRRRPPQAG